MTGVIIRHEMILGDLRSTGGLVPVRVWVSYESMAREAELHEAAEQFTGPIRVKN